MTFIDTNVLLYAISSDLEEAGKLAIAETVLARSDLCLSVQVLQEFVARATSPKRPVALSHAQALAAIAQLRRFPIQDTTLAVFDAAMETKVRYQLSDWDSAIIAAAQAQGCTELLTEDLTHGQRFGRLAVRNPFA